MPLPFALLLAGPILVVGGRLLYDQLNREESSDEEITTPNPEDQIKKRNRDRQRRAFIKERRQIIERLAEQHNLAISKTEIEQLPTKEFRHRNLLRKAINRRAMQYRRTPKQEKAAWEVLTALHSELCTLRLQAENLRADNRKELDE